MAVVNQVILTTSYLAQTRQTKQTLQTQTLRLRGRGPRGRHPFYISDSGRPWYWFFDIQLFYSCSTVGTLPQAMHSCYSKPVIRHPRRYYIIRDILFDARRARKFRKLGLNKSTRRYGYAQRRIVFDFDLRLRLAPRDA